MNRCISRNADPDPLADLTVNDTLEQWHEKQVYHYGPRSDIDLPKKDIFREEDFDVHETYPICPHANG